MNDRWDNGYPSGGNYWADYGYYFQSEDNCSGSSQNICTDPDGIGDTPYTLRSGQNDRYPLAVHDVEITSVDTLPSVIQGKTIPISVTIQNLGNVVERSFTVELSFNNTLIESQTVMGLAQVERVFEFFLGYRSPPREGSHARQVSLEHAGPILTSSSGLILSPPLEPRDSRYCELISELRRNYSNREGVRVNEIGTSL